MPSEYCLNFEVEHTATSFTARALSSAQSHEIKTLLQNFSIAVHDIVDNPDRFAGALPEGLRDLPLEIVSEDSSRSTQPLSRREHTASHKPSKIMPTQKLSVVRNTVVLKRAIRRHYYRNIANSFVLVRQLLLNSTRLHLSTKLPWGNMRTSFVPPWPMSPK